MLRWLLALPLIACTAASELPAGTGAPCAGKCDGDGPDAGPATFSVPSLYSEWTFPAAGHYNIDSRMRIDVDPGTNAPLFWSAQFGIVASNTGGYIGIQDGAARGDGTIGKLAIFSIWDATSAAAGDPGAWCQTFGGEGSGYSCRIAYDWAAGDVYRTRIWEVEAGTWRGAVLDEATGVETVLGDITVPADWQLLDDWVTNFTEDYEQNVGVRYASCNDAPSTSAVFFAPTADALTVSITGSQADVATDATCTNVVSTISSDASYGTQQLNPP